MYKFLSEKHGWTVEEIDRQDFFKTMEIEFEVSNNPEDDVVFIDQLGF